jgi:hypothetical protein
MTDGGPDWLEPEQRPDDGEGDPADAGGPWLVRFAGRRTGPFDAARLRTLARRGGLTRLHQVSVDGQRWAPATTLRAVFNADGSVVSGPAIAVERSGDEDRTEASAEQWPDTPPAHEAPPARVRARRGAAASRPVVIAALVMMMVMLAVPTSRDGTGTACWWWSEGPVTLTLRAMAAASALGWWWLVFARSNAARAAAAAGLAALLASTASAPLFRWAPWCIPASPIVAMSALLVAVESAGGRSLRPWSAASIAAGATFGSAGLLLGVLALRGEGLGSAAAVLSLMSAVLCACAGVALACGGIASWRGRSGDGFWWSVAASIGGMASLFASAFGGIAGEDPMLGAQAAAGACVTLGFAALAWASVHEAVENAHLLGDDGS